uniref:AlNc14C80G5267 protein n=1 Tax=Albugo laibachii Nc14 TaxID=890382 RepID=F0WF73_9STRA|nr:AlNc14C80G5267 [Albugo laibachii Nc14]|eukprot:CCA19855.1 AlNc14C80G5267 [Albugo laibachii Nc14]
MGAGLVVLDHQHAEKSIKQKDEKNVTPNLNRDKSVMTLLSPHIPLLRLEKNSAACRGKLVLLGLDGAGKSTLYEQLRNVCNDDRVPDTRCDAPTTKAEKSGIFNSELPNEIPSRLRWSASSPRPFAFSTSGKAKATSTIIRFEPETAYQLICVPGDRVSRKTWRSFWLSKKESSSQSRSKSISTIENVSQSVDKVPFHAPVFIVDACDRIRFPTITHEIVKAFLDNEMRDATSPSLSFLILFNKVDALGNINAPEGNLLLQETRKEFKKCVNHELTRQYCQRGFIAAQIKSTRSQGSVDDGQTYRSEMESSRNTRNSRRSDVRGVNMSYSVTTHSNNLLSLILECSCNQLESVRLIASWLKKEVLKAQ